MNKATELFEHMQNYTREVFAERLREEGFSSYKGQDVHWYRLVNNEVVQAVYFVIRHTMTPAFAEIRYGCHPLFISPIFQKSPYMHGVPGYEQMSNLIPKTTSCSTIDDFDGLLLNGMYNNRPYRVPDALIFCSPDQNNGLDVLEKLLPVLDKKTTPLACYELHKTIRKPIIDNNSTGMMTSYFVDEVLYWQDKKLYSYCKEFVKQEVRHLEYCQKNGWSIEKARKPQVERCTILRQVFESGNFADYLQTFPEREQETLRLLERNVGIQRKG